MAGAIEIIDPEGDRRRKMQRRLVVLAFLIAMSVLAVAPIKNFTNKWVALTGARQLSSYLNGLKISAILKKTALEVRIGANGAFEVLEVSSCAFNAQRKKLFDKNIADFAPGARFVPVAEVTSSMREYEVEGADPVITRFCYDPLSGSSLHADGAAVGGIYLAGSPSPDLEEWAEIRVEGQSGDIELVGVF